LCAKSRRVEAKVGRLQVRVRPGLEKNLGFLEIFFRFLGFLRFFLGFLGFNVGPTQCRTHENICLLIHYLLQCAQLPNLKVIGK